MLILKYPGLEVDRIHDDYDDVPFVKVTFTFTHGITVMVCVLYCDEFPSS